MSEIEKIGDDIEDGMAKYTAAMGNAARVSAEAVTRAQMDAASKFPVTVRTDRQQAQWISARIDRRKRRLQIVPEDLPSFEAANGGAYAALRALTNGDWTIDLVRKVLAFASLPADERKNLAKLTKFAGVMGVSSLAITVPVWLDDTLSMKPPAPLAGLAALILTAALFGIPDAEAVWSDEADG